MDSSFNPSHSSLKNHLKSTVFSLVALSVIGLTSQAVAQDGLAKNTSALQPAGGWSVTRVGEGQADANTYCALSVEYPNAFMTVAQNKNNELSVAIEDETLSLQKDKTYDLWLKVGGQYATTMDMKPASEQGFILKLGQDSAFLNALRRQEALRLNASEWSVDLALNDFSLGLDELKVCLEGPEVLVDKQPEDMQAVTTTANLATIADVPPPPGSDVPAAEIAARQAKKEAAQQEKILPDALERPRPDASARVERSDKIAQNLPQGGERDPGQRPSYFSNPERMQLDEGDDASGDIVWNTQRVVLSETGLDRAAPQSQDMEARPDVEQRLRMENRQLAAALESQRRKFEQAVSEPRQDNVVQELSKRVELLLAENRNLKQQISKGQNIGVQDLKVDQSVRERANQIETQARAIASLRDENERLNAIVASLKNDRLSTQIQADAAQQYEQSLSRLTSEIQNLQAENSRLKQSLNRLSENQQRVAQQQGALEQARIRFEEAERQNKRLGQKLMEERENYARALTDMRGQFETQESIASARTASPAQD